MTAFLRAVSLLAVRLFYRTIALGGREHLPERGPCIIVANHPNGLLDPVLSRLVLKKPLGILAKSTLFGNPLGRAFCEAFHAIPIYRSRDAADTSQNERTFQLCRDRLAQQGWIMLFPEGTSHSDPTMRPLKTGTARIALSAEAAHEFKLGLRIVPLGLVYEDKEIFRSRAGITIGEPLTLTRFAAQYAQDERAAVEALTVAIDDALGTVVLEAESHELWNGFLAVATWTNPDGGRDFAASEARARALAQAYRRVASEEPERAARVVERTRRFSQVLKAVGIEHPFALEGATGPRSVAAFLAPLVTLWPVAIIGTVLAFVPYQLVRLFSGRIFHLEPDLTGTIKVLAGMLFFPLAFVGEAVAAGLLWKWPAGVATLLFAPAASYIAMRYWERVSLRREAFRGWWLRLNRGSLVDAIRERRRELCQAVEAELAG